VSRSDSRASCKTRHRAGPKLTMCPLPQRSPRRVRMSLPVTGLVHEKRFLTARWEDRQRCSNCGIATEHQFRPTGPLHLRFAASSHVDDRS
jgi:hypothetical protein